MALWNKIGKEVLVRPIYEHHKFLLTEESQRYMRLLEIQKCKEILKEI